MEGKSEVTATQFWDLNYLFRHIKGCSCSKRTLNKHFFRNYPKTKAEKLEINKRTVYILLIFMSLLFVTFCQFITVCSCNFVCINRCCVELVIDLFNYYNLFFVVITVIFVINYIFNIAIM
jgi:hypothetical protein